MSIARPRFFHDFSIEEVLEGIREERMKIYERYGVRNAGDLVELITRHRISLEEAYMIRNRLYVLDKMEEIIYSEILSNTSNSYYSYGVLNRIRSLLKQLKKQFP